MRSLDIFLTWYTWGGMNRGLNLTEIVEMPAWLMKDFRYLMSRFRKIKAGKEAYKKIAQDAKIQARRDTLQG